MCRWHWCGLECWHNGRQSGATNHQKQRPGQWRLCCLLYGPRLPSSPTFCSPKMKTVKFTCKNHSAASQSVHHMGKNLWAFPSTSQGPCADHALSAHHKKGATSPGAGDGSPCPTRFQSPSTVAPPFRQRLNIRLSVELWKRHSNTHFCGTFLDLERTIFFCFL